MSAVLILSIAVLLVLGSAVLLYVLFQGSIPGQSKNVFQKIGLVLLVSTILFSLGTVLVVTFSPKPSAGPITSNEEGLPEVRPDELNRSAPDFAFRLVNDDTGKRLSQYKGQVVLLNFWATWCGPCRIEMPELNRLQAAYRDRGLVILTISDEPKPDLVEFQQQNGFEMVSGYVGSPDELPEPFIRTLAVRPTTYVIDGEGILRSYTIGAGTYESFEKAIEPYL